MISAVSSAQTITNAPMIFQVSSLRREIHSQCSYDSLWVVSDGHHLDSVRHHGTL
jgi:hypothetical protein